jgi:hypothetical protein
MEPPSERILPQHVDPSGIPGRVVGSITLDGNRDADDFAASIADRFLEEEETYHGYVFLLLAADAGEEEAGDDMDTLFEVDQVCDEDVHLAELQVVLWYHHGHLVGRDDARAAEHAAVVARVSADAGWPPSLDVTLPLGPAMPFRPHHLHDRRGAL